MKVKVVNVDPIETQADYEYQYSSRAQADSPSRARFNTSLSLILRSRGLVPSDAQIIKFSLRQTRLLLQVADASIQSGVINRIYRVDIDEEIVPSFDSLLFPSEGLFMRLGACLAKDGRQRLPPGESAYGPYSTLGKKPRSLPLRSIPELLLLLLTSIRARNAVFHAIEEQLVEFELFFLSYNDRMQSRMVFRVFCRPFQQTGSLRITGISQYRCPYGPWFSGPWDNETKEQAIERAAQAREAISKHIAAELDLETKDEKGIRHQPVEAAFSPGLETGKTLEGHGDPDDVEFRLSYRKIIDYVSSDDEDDES
ncbi:hypothetical protein F5Y18DRAFT_443576 [Xylariaceae sp. FL1019]|nr:hypothetical protein F5Y18DRAFT_443576 [Xylariaceae sp. FL1019]